MKSGIETFCVVLYLYCIPYVYVVMCHDDHGKLFMYVDNWHQELNLSYITYIWNLNLHFPTNPQPPRWKPQKTCPNLTQQNGGLVETSPGSIQSRSLRNPSPLQSSSARYCRESHRRPRPQRLGNHHHHQEFLRVVPPVGFVVACLWFGRGRCHVFVGGCCFFGIVKFLIPSMVPPCNTEI